MAKETWFDKIFKFLLHYFIDMFVFVALFPFFKIFDLLNLNPGSISSPEMHKRKVQRVQSQVLDWNRKGRKSLMCTARKTWKTLSSHNMKKSRFTQIEVDMDDIIDVDVVNQVLTVEPGMSMGNLTKILIPMGWTIPVVPELEPLTIGGLVCGAGLETSSHQYGLFADTCFAYEVVLADGSLVNATKDENVDLFHGIPSSFGTLGFVTAVKFPLIPAAKYVKLEYFPAQSLAKVMQLLNTKGQEFVEGILYSQDAGVVMFGNMVHEAIPSQVNPLNRWYQPWFYKHAESFLNHPADGSGCAHTEYVPLRNYYHRHTRSYFWEIAALIPLGNHPLLRFLFGWIYPINFQFAKLIAIPAVWEYLIVKNHLLQDFVVPMSDVEPLIKLSHELVQIYPIWLCPCKIFKKPGMVGEIPADAMYCDVGVYGNTELPEKFHPIKTTMQFEQFTIKTKGFQGMYADSYLSKEDFRRMFSTRLYDKLRVELGCLKAFPDMYDKVSHHARGIEA